MTCSRVFVLLVVMGLIPLHFFGAFFNLEDLSPGDPELKLRAKTDSPFTSVQLLKNGQHIECKPRRLHDGKKWEFLCVAGNDCCCQPDEVCVYQAMGRYPNSTALSNNVTVHIEGHIADPDSESSPPTKRETYSHTLTAALTTSDLRGENDPPSGNPRTLNYYIAVPIAIVVVLGFFAFVVVIIKDRRAVRTRKQSKAETALFIPDGSQNSTA